MNEWDVNIAQFNLLFESSYKNISNFDILFNVVFRQMKREKVTIKHLLRIFKMDFHAE